MLLIFLIVLSRNNILSRKKISLPEKEGLMKKLNQRKIRWIVKEIDKGGLSKYSIAKQQKITPQHAGYVYKKYKGIDKPKLLPSGRKTKEISEEEKKIVENTFKEYCVCAVTMEAILDERGVHIPHNRIHTTLKEKQLAKNELKKQERRKWVRYERRHSMTQSHPSKEFK